MAIDGAFIMPHPPVILPEVGGGSEREIEKTSRAFDEAARRIAALEPETVVLFSPHSLIYSDYFHISPGAGAKGDFSRFRAPDAVVEASYDEDFVRQLSDAAADAGIEAGTLGERSEALDHGTMVPLYFLNKRYSGYKLVRIGLSGLPASEHYRLGMLVRSSAEALGRRTVIIASGDLSHKVAHGGPYGYADEGVQFDREVTEAMASGDFMRFLSFEPDFLEKAAECGLRSFIMMAGALDGDAVKSELLSYEGKLGVGYAVACFETMGADPERRFLDRYLASRREAARKRREAEDEYVKLARYSLEHYVKTKKRAKLPDNLSSGLTALRAGVFVSLKKEGQLRGCIGTIAPVTSSIAEEILRNAVSAGAEDPRFSPVRESELDELTYSVDVLSASEPIGSIGELDVRRYGVIVNAGHRRGLLLPNLDGVDTPEQQVEIALQKAGIKPGESYSMERFEVVRHK